MNSPYSNKARSDISCHAVTTAHVTSAEICMTRLQFNLSNNSLFFFSVLINFSTESGHEKSSLCSCCSALKVIRINTIKRTISNCPFPARETNMLCNDLWVSNFRANWKSLLCLKLFVLANHELFFTYANGLTLERLWRRRKNVSCCSALLSQSLVLQKSKSSRGFNLLVKFQGAKPV